MNQYLDGFFIRGLARRAHRAPPPSPPSASELSRFDLLRTELADLAFDLERQGRRDAADIVMQIDARVRELAGEAAR